MSAQALLDRLSDIGATVTADGGDVVVRAPMGVLTEELRVEIRANKWALLAAVELTEPPVPYLTPDGDLRIPFDSDPRYHWWKKGGQTVRETLEELNAPIEVLRKYVSRN